MLYLMLQRVARLCWDIATDTLTLMLVVLIKSFFVNSRNNILSSQVQLSHKTFDVITSQVMNHLSAKYVK